MPLPASPLEYQLDILKLEIETVNATIRQMDEITKSVKEWTIGLWTASIGGALVTDELTGYVGLTAVIPLLFWFVDTWHRRIQRKFIWRSIEISKFLNDDRLPRSIGEGRLVGITLLDPKSRMTRGADYEDFVSWKKILLFRSLSILYAGLAAVSVTLGILVLTGVLRRA